MPFHYEPLFIMFILRHIIALYYRAPTPLEYPYFLEKTLEAEGTWWILFSLLLLLNEYTLLPSRIAYMFIEYRHIHNMTLYDYYIHY